MDELIVVMIAQAFLFFYPAWRIYYKAGLIPALSLTVLIPGLGILVCALILLFSKWQVQPVGGD